MLVVDISVVEILWRLSLIMMCFVGVHCINDFTVVSVVCDEVGDYFGSGMMIEFAVVFCCCIRIAVVFCCCIRIAVVICCIRICSCFF